jgi:hypothetical protein
MMEERRQHQRLVPDPPVFARVEGIKRGPVLDLSEGGLAFGGVISNRLFSMILDLPDGNGLMQIQAEIAWASHSRNIIGVRFVQLAGNCRQRLRNWTATRAYPAAEQVDAGVWQSPALQMISDDISTDSIPNSDDSQPNSSSKNYVVEILLAALFLCSAFVCIGYYLPNLAGRSSNAGPISMPLPAPQPAKAAVVSNATTAAKPDLLPARLPLDASGYVVQVGAMAHEENADALAVALHVKSFPAFVFRRGGDRFYRVAVGPYADENSTMQVKEQIEKEGYATILRSWSPE